jgi:hypothetical protein
MEKKTYRITLRNFDGLNYGDKWTITTKKYPSSNDAAILAFYCVEIVMVEEIK